MHKQSRVPLQCVRCTCFSIFSDFGGNRLLFVVTFRPPILLCYCSCHLLSVYSVSHHVSRLICVIWVCIQNNIVLPSPNRRVVNQIDNLVEIHISHLEFRHSHFFVCQKWNTTTFEHILYIVVFCFSSNYFIVIDAILIIILSHQAFNVRRTSSIMGCEKCIDFISSVLETNNENESATDSTELKLPVLHIRYK